MNEMNNEEFAAIRQRISNLLLKEAQRNNNLEATFAAAFIVSQLMLASSSNHPETRRFIREQLTQCHRRLMDACETLRTGILKA